MNIAPYDYWQKVFEPGARSAGLQPDGHSCAATLPDGRAILLPVRVLPGDGSRAVASLIVNQASFAVLDALADTVADALSTYRPEVIIGVPTLGLPLAEGVARRLGHPRLVALGTSRKFWYDENLSEPLSSITTPGQGKRLYLDPRMRPLLEGRRVAVVDDVLSTGSSMRAVRRLLEVAGYPPVAIGAAMLQSDRWREAVGKVPVLGAFDTPLLERGADGWQPITTLPDASRPSPR